MGAGKGCPTFQVEKIIILIIIYIYLTIVNPNLKLTFVQKCYKHTYHFFLVIEPSRFPNWIQDRKLHEIIYSSPFFNSCKNNGQWTLSFVPKPSISYLEKKDKIFYLKIKKHSKSIIILFCKKMEWLNIRGQKLF